jgi:diguanylate cyclase (GGDEF)-like protein
MKTMSLPEAMISLTRNRDRIVLIETMIRMVETLFNAKKVSLYSLFSEEGGVEFSEENIGSARYFETLYPRSGVFDVSVHKNVELCIRSKKPVLVKSPGDNAETIFFPILGPRGGAQQFLQIDYYIAERMQRKFLSYILTIYRDHYLMLHKGETDHLTGLMNRQSLSGKINEKIIRFYRGELKKTPFFCLFDVDHLRGVNDIHGMVMGDEILLHLARILENAFRSSGEVYRYGGEEFAILMEAQTAADAMTVCNEIRKKIEQYRFPGVGTVTASTGFTAIRADDDIYGIFDRAERAMNYAKGNGRNQVQSFEDLITAGLIGAPQSTAAPDVVIWKKR